eukprot:2728442-Pleurochrysis_carterae.AAC.1
MLGGPLRRKGVVEAHPLPLCASSDRARVFAALLLVRCSRAANKARRRRTRTIVCCVGAESPCGPTRTRQVER